MQQDSENRQQKPPALSEKTPAEKTPAEKTPETAPEKDWWDGFKSTLEDPDASVYLYMRGQVLKSLEMDGTEGIPEATVKARQKAFRELAALKDPREISKKLALMEGQAFLFGDAARAGIKLLRVTIDNYVAAQDGEAAKSGKEAALLENRSPEEIETAVRKAAQRMQGDPDASRLAADAVAFSRKYLKPEYMVTALLCLLPLVTWQYRWTLALGLGAFAARKAFWHGGKAAASLLRGDGTGARASGHMVFESLKEAGATILVVGVSPAVAGLPVAVQTFASVGIEAGYKSTVALFASMLAEEEKKPGSTPVSKGIRAGAKKFFGDYQDALATGTARFLKETTALPAAAAAEQAVARARFSRIRHAADEARQVCGLLARRFNAKAGNAPKIADLQNASAAFAESARRAAADDPAGETAGRVPGRPADKGPAESLPPRP